MTKPTQDKETLREAVARVLCELHIRTVRRHDTPPDELEAMLPGSVDYAWRDFIPQADAAIATMFERLRTPILATRLEAVYERCKLWPEKSQDGMMALLELRNMVDAEILPILRNPQAMLAAFQQENSDA